MSSSFTKSLLHLKFLFRILLWRLIWQISRSTSSRSYQFLCGARNAFQIMGTVQKCFILASPAFSLSRANPLDPSFTQIADCEFLASFPDVLQSADRPVSLTYLPRGKYSNGFGAWNSISHRKDCRVWAQHQQCPFSAKYRRPSLRKVTQPMELFCTGCRQ